MPMLTAIHNAWAKLIQLTIVYSIWEHIHYGGMRLKIPWCFSRDQSNDTMNHIPWTCDYIRRSFHIILVVVCLYFLYLNLLLSHIHFAMVSQTAVVAVDTCLLPPVATPPVETASVFGNSLYSPKADRLLLLVSSCPRLLSGQLGTSQCTVCCCLSRCSFFLFWDISS